MLRKMRTAAFAVAVTLVLGGLALAQYRDSDDYYYNRENGAQATIKAGWVHLVCSSKDTVTGTALVFDPATRVCIIVGVMETAMLIIGCMIAAATASMMAVATATTVAEATGIIGRGLAALATMALTTSATRMVLRSPART